MKYALAAVALFFMVGVFCAQETQKSETKEQPSTTAGTAAQPQHPVKISAEDIARKNPLKFTETSVQRGKKLYDTQCAMCHGKNADGKGDVVEEMKIHPTDFTKPDALKDRTDGELFAIITAGSQIMPGQGTRMLDRQKWQLVNYLRAAGGKTPEKSTQKEPEENILLIPQ